MNVSPVASSPQPSIHAHQTAKINPFKHDRDRDHDNNAAEVNRSKAAEGSKSGSLLDIEA